MNYPTNSKSRIAGGTIRPFSFIMGQPGVVLGALQCSGSNVPIIGIGPEWTNEMMGTQWQRNYLPAGYPAAVAGQSIRVYEDGEDALILVGSGQTVSPDDYLTSDASGYAVRVTNPLAGTVYIGARAIEGGTAGQVIRVQVRTRP